jgi:hypothetical protein
MSDPVLHIVFSESAGGTLRQAGFGRKGGKIVVFPDNLSFGPIDPPDPVARLAWVEKELGLTDGGDWLAGALETFWAAAQPAPGRRVVWFSRRSASDYAGFLECLWRFGEARCDVVDLTDVVPQRLPVFGLGELHPDYVRENALFARAKELPPAIGAQYRETWRRLRAENAPFRIVKDLKLVSAPMTVHDDLLLACAGVKWRKSARVIGEAIADGYGHVGDLVLFGRLRRLVEAGKLEARGDLSAMGSSEVRLSPLSAKREA